MLCYHSIDPQGRSLIMITTEYRAHLQTYNQAVDKAWAAIEEAIVAMNEVNDTLYSEAGDIKHRCPRGDVNLLLAKVKELSGEISSMQNAQEPRNQAVLLPGEYYYS
jgi:hypothetical protein